MIKIKVLLADDHAVLRAGLKALLNDQPDIEVIGEAATGKETIFQSDKLHPDVVVMDITMPERGGVEVTKELKLRNPEIKVLVLTMHEDEEYLRQMLRAGADSYVPKKAADTDLLEAIRATYRGEHFIHSSMTAGLITEVRTGVPMSHEKKLESGGLSERETEVLRLLAAGHTNQEIADKLYLSIKTVETYKARLKEKLGIKSRAQLVRYAISTGLLSSEFEHR
ncbi:MAG: DNA-binding response regulator [Chloroflexi bacterium RBG_16_50_9]|nr:MAG: DNA-binding response regulator [Chloroflexi bacterium RBG_16_50_9]